MDCPENEEHQGQKLKVLPYGSDPYAVVLCAVCDAEIEKLTVPDHIWLKKTMPFQELPNCELTPDTFNWLHELIREALKEGLEAKGAFITEKISNELGSDFIERTLGNDGDYAWHGKVKLVTSFQEQLLKGINLYGLIRGVIYEHSLAERGIREDGSEIVSGEDV